MRNLQCGKSWFILNDNFEMVSLAPKMDGANRRCVSASEFECNFRSGEIGSAAIASFECNL